MKIKEFKEQCVAIENTLNRHQKKLCKASLLKEFATDKQKLEKATRLMYEFLQSGLRRFNDDEII